MHTKIILPVVVLALSIAFLDPFMVLMPVSVVYICLGLLLIAVLSYSLLVWQETVQDEREHFIRAHVGRMSYIAGVLLLTVGIIYQVLILHDVDPFLVITLTGMTIVKYAGSAYAQNKL